MDDISTNFPLLNSEHKILGNEFCSGYSDVFGKWNTGFYCPQSESKTAVSCCGTPTYKYCCTDPSRNEPTKNVEQPAEILTTPIIIGIVGGMIAIIFLIVLTSCYLCSCCLFYKKRRAHLPQGLYRMPLTSSSTTNALTYSNSSNFSNNTPVESAGWLQFQQNQVCNNARNTNHPNNLSTPTLNNGNGPQNWVNSQIYHSNLQQYISPNNFQNQNNRVNYTHATLPRYFYHHQNQNAPRPNNNSSLNGNGFNSTTPCAGPPSNGAPNQRPAPRPTQNGTLSGQQSHIGYTISAESRPYLISNNFLSGGPLTESIDRPRSVISFKNNVAYITSSLPLSNSFTMGRSSVRSQQPEVSHPEVSHPEVSQPQRSNFSSLRKNVSFQNAVKNFPESKDQFNETLNDNPTSSHHLHQGQSAIKHPKGRSISLEHLGKKDSELLDQNDLGIDLKLTSDSPQNLTSTEGIIKGVQEPGATGCETIGSDSRSALFTHPNYEPLGTSPEMTKEKVSMKMVQIAENALENAQFLPSVPKFHHQNECQVLRGNGPHPPEPHYKVISSPSTSNATSSPISSKAPIINKAPTKLNIVIPLIETHRVVL